METSPSPVLTGIALEKDSEWIYLLSTYACETPCQASWEGYRNEDEFGDACNLVKETNIYINHQHQADNSHTRPWKIKRDFLLLGGWSTLARTWQSEECRALAVGEAFHQDPSWEEGNSRKLTTWVWLELALDGGCGRRGERESSVR